MKKIFVKKEDNILVIAGKNKGKQGKVLEVSPDNNTVLVENVNIVSRHTKPKSQEDKGGIVKRPAPFDVSNVMVICPVCNKATRVAHKEVEGKNTRCCKKCGAPLDKKYTKVAKAENKKQVKETAKAEKATKKSTAIKATKTTTKTAVKTAEKKQTKNTAVRKTASGK